MDPTEFEEASVTAGTDLARRLELVGGAATLGAGAMAVLWAFLGRNVGPAARGPAVFTASVSLWWGLFAVIGIAAAAGALLVGRRRSDPRRGRLRWGALVGSILLLAAGRFFGAVPF